MSEIRWWSQPFPPEGGQTAEGIKRQLGRPRLPEYAVLVREAVQNSWDARRDDGERAIEVRFELRRLGGYAVAWRRTLGTTSGASSGPGLLNKLNSDSWILTVSDRGTNGLGGPIRSDEPHVPGVSADFVQFIRNVGEPRDKQFGGGTYGFGKGVFYRVSEAGAILVDTLNSEGDARSRRLMGAALGGIETAPDGRRLTGRHWWGQINDGIPDPLLDTTAAEVAAELGLPGFADGRTGTDVTVLLPDLQLDEIEHDPQMLGEQLRGYLYWYLWPKMGSLTRRRDIDFSLSIDGREFQLPEIHDLPVLSEFAKTLDNVASRGGNDFTMPTHANKYGRLGHLSIEFTLPDVFHGETEVWSSIERVAPIQRPYRHVCRMRQTELVVDYFEGEPMPVTNIGYVGSFVTSQSVDEFFAQAEPPTHDAWEVGTLSGSAKGIVQGAKRFLIEECRKQVEARTGAKSKAVRGLGRLSSSLGALVQGATGTRPGPQKKGSGAPYKGGSSPGRSSRVKTVQYSHVVVDNGTPYVECVVEIPDGVPEGTRLRASASVLLAGGRSENPADAPLGSADPEILYWYFGEDRSDRVEGAELGWDRLKPGRWTIRACALEDVSIRIAFVEDAPNGQ
ncbi:MAG: hypothetical protein WBH51_11825 [Mycolicibacter algericus]|uniref:hypothetical protein n=1 Tax=Mycolicibacter algericus TaxID=1288388 RepID=UPI003C755278